MRVLLVSANTERTAIIPLPLGLAFVAAACRRAGHETALLDLMSERDAIPAIQTRIEEFRPGVIGISVRNIDDQNMARPKFLLPAVREIVAVCRRRCDAPIVLGGPGYSLFPESVLRFLQADMGIRGEGEKVFPALLERLESGSRQNQRYTARHLLILLVFRPAAGRDYSGSSSASMASGTTVRARLRRRLPTLDEWRESAPSDKGANAGYRNPGSRIELGNELVAGWRQTVAHSFVLVLALGQSRGLIELPGGSLCCGLFSRRGRLRGRLLDRRFLNRRTLLHRLFDSGLFSGGPLGWLCLRGFGSLLRPPLLGGSDDCRPSGHTEFSLRFGGFRHSWHLGFAPDSCPSTLLGFLHPPPGRCGELLSPADGRFRRGGSLSGAAGEHLAKLCDLSVYLLLLGLEAENGSFED